MLVVRLDRTAESGGGHWVEVTLSAPALPRVRPQRATARSGFTNHTVNQPADVATDADTAEAGLRALAICGLAGSTS